MTILTEQLYAVAKKLDFVDGRTEALRVINSDVDQATKGLISKLLDTIDSTTQLIIVNAIYFNGLWEKSFNPKQTIEDGDFHTTGGKIVKTPMMHMIKSFSFFKDPETGMKIVQLNYQKEGNIAMVFILPKEGVGVETLLKSNQLIGKNFEKLLAKLSKFEVNIMLPRFKLNATHMLVEPLRQLGIRDIFDPSKANLTLISANTSRRLCVSEIIQKAVIEVSEKGTEAAAATAVMVLRFCAMSPKQAQFTADRPFLFALVTTDTIPRQILFVGVVEDPTKNE